MSVSEVVQQETLRKASKYLDGLSMKETWYLLIRFIIKCLLHDITDSPASFLFINQAFDLILLTNPFGRPTSFFRNMENTYLIFLSPHK